LETGGIDSMASIRKRNNNSYEIRVSCGYDASGKQKYQQMTWRPSEGMTEKQIEKEVQRQAVLFEEKCKLGGITANIKFEEFAEQWFAEYAKWNLRADTYDRLHTLTTRVYPALGHLKLKNITVRHIQQFVNDLCTNAVNKRNKGGLARSTVIKYLSFVSSIFAYAVNLELVAENPCKKVIVPKGIAYEKEVYTLSEMQQLLKLLEKAPMKYRLFIIMAVYTGFRRGELLGLEWDDIDWENRIIKVRRTSNYTQSKGIYTDTTKTKRSQRSNKYPQALFDLLYEYKGVQENEKRKVGSKWQDCGRIFVTGFGAPMTPCTPYTWLKTFCKNNGMRFCGIHGFRHLHASLLIYAGVDVATVSADLGHVNSNTTLSVYTHEFDEVQARTSDVIEKALDFSTNKSFKKEKK